MSKKGSKKNKKTKKGKPEENIHTRIAQPNSLRKNVLALTIEVIEALKKYEYFKELRANKLVLLDDLKKEAKQINKLSKELELHELPLDLKDVKKMAKTEDKHEKIETVTTNEEIDEKWQKIQKELQKTSKEEKVKPKNKLDGDLQSLREKMAQL